MSIVDKNGVPMVHLGKKKVALFNTNNPKNELPSGNLDTSSSDLKNTDFISIGKNEIAGWFDTSNSRPWTMRDKYLRKSSVLKSAIKYKTDLAVAQGVFGVKVEGYDADGSEIISMPSDAKVNKFLQSRTIRKMQSSIYDNLYSHGNGYIHVVLGRNAKEISIVESLDAPFSRLGRKDKKGALTNLFFYSRWHESRPSESDMQRFKIIDTRMPLELQVEQAKKLKSFVYPVDFKTSGAVYYADEPWATAYESGHLDITLKVAKFTASMFDNQASIKYHIKIPYSYWEGVFPISDYPTPEARTERQKLIEQRLDEIEDDICSSENARKTIFSHYSVGDDGKPKDGWVIDVIDDKLTSQHYLPQAAASNAEVFTALGINPAVKGLQMAAGPYANQSGGSNIREAFLVDSALAWGDRQEVIDPIALMLNIMGYEDLSVRTRQIVLTTLDSGAGTSKKVS